MANLKRYDNQMRRERDVRLVGGVDEAGRGALAGPVIAAVVVLGPEAVLTGVNDSKQLSAEERESFVPQILAKATAAALGIASAEEVDRVNVLQATHLAAGRALAALGLQPELLITDYLWLREPPCPLIAIAEGDATSLAVAAASVLAKVARDRIMRLLEAEFPQYGFAKHKGYGTREHWSALETHGPSTIHRLTYNGVCWFDAAPGVRSLSAERGRLPSSLPFADPMSLLCGDIANEFALAYLPECEFRIAPPESVQVI